METQRQETHINFPARAGVDVARLERELAALWPAPDESGGGRGVMRACVLNLVVYAADGEDRARLDSLLDEVYEQNPSRALVVVAAGDGGDAERLDAYVSTRCSLSTKGARQVCGEQVTIEAGRGAVGRAASVVEPLLVPDVPVFLWWKDIPDYEDRLFGRLVEMCDRLVIDSAQFDRPRADLLRLSEVINGHAPRLAVSDLNWSRLTPWRSLAAGFWDVADYRPLLGRIDRVEIAYARADGAAGEIPPAPLLLTGWLASRLGWEARGASKDEGRAVVRLSAAGGRELEVRLNSSDASDSSAEGAYESEEFVRGGGLRSLTFFADGGAAEFCVGLKGGGKLETLTRTGAREQSLGRVIDFERQSEGRRLASELSIHTRDAAYEQAVAACALALRALGRAGVEGGGGAVQEK